MKTSTSNNIINFWHPILTPEELFNGTRLGIDSWADTSCAGKHAYVESFVEGKTVNATGFSSALGSMKNLPIVNVVYAYDKPNGETILLENYNAIYLGTNMNDSLLNPIQAEENEVHIDIRPTRYYPSEKSHCQSIHFPDGTSLPLEYEGVLPYLPIRRPTPDELDTCTRLSITPEHGWNPYDPYNGFISNVSNTTQEENEDPISSNLLCNHLQSALLSNTCLSKLTMNMSRYLL
jgi:hypothetical protein